MTKVDCPRYAACWTGADNRTVRLLCQLISQTIERGAAPDADEEIPPDVMRVCARGHAIPRRLGGILRDFSEQRRSELKRGGANQLISAQFLQAQMLLRGLADQQAQPMRVRSRAADLTAPLIRLLVCFGRRLNASRRQGNRLVFIRNLLS